MAARFSSHEHSERLRQSAEILDFEIPYSVAEIDAAKQLVLDKNGLEDAYVRPVAWRGSRDDGGRRPSTTPSTWPSPTWEWPSMFDSRPR